MRRTPIAAAGLAVLVLAAALVPAAAKENCRRALARPQQPPVAIDFAADSAELLPHARDELERLAPQLLQGTDLQICVIARADGEGDSAYNRSLAERRAEVVIRALSAAGLPSERITVEVDAADAVSFHPLERRILVIEARR